MKNRVPRLPGTRFFFCFFQGRPAAGMPKRLCCRMVQVPSFCLGWEGKWVRLVFCWWGRQRASPGLDKRELHAGSIVARGKGVAGGKACVFNEELGNVGVTGGGGVRRIPGTARTRR